MEGDYTFEITPYSVQNEEFANAFPGEFKGITQYGAITAIESFGFIDVNVKNAKKLKLKNGKKAVLKLKAAENSPDTIPLWYYDFDEGTWKEEGVCYKKDGFFVGEVAHFTPWNVDKPIVFNGGISGKVVDQNGVAIEGADIVQKIKNIRVVRRAKTNKNGRFNIPTLIGSSIQITAHFSYYNSESINFKDREINRLENIVISKDIYNIIPAYVAADTIFVSIGRKNCLKGNYFGDEQGEQKLLINGKECETLSWSNCYVCFDFPENNPQIGELRLTRKGFEDVKKVYKVTWELWNKDLFKGIKDGDLDKVKKSLAGGAKINLLNDNGYPPLMYALFWERKDIFEFLLKSGAKYNPKFETQYGHNYLMAYCKAGMTDSVEKFLSAGFDINKTDDDGLSPIFYAVAGYQNELVSYLIKKGADYKRHDYHGRNLFDAGKFSLADNYYNDELTNLGVKKTKEEERIAVLEKIALNSKQCNLNNLYKKLKPKNKADSLQIEFERDVCLINFVKERIPKKYSHYYREVLPYFDDYFFRDFTIENIDYFESRNVELFKRYKEKIPLCFGRQLRDYCKKYITYYKKTLKDNAFARQKFNPLFGQGADGAYNATVANRINYQKIIKSAIRYCKRKESQKNRNHVRTALPEYDEDMEKIDQSLNESYGELINLIREKMKNKTTAWPKLSLGESDLKWVIDAQKKWLEFRKYKTLLELSLPSPENADKSDKKILIGLWIKINEDRIKVFDEWISYIEANS